MSTRSTALLRNSCEPYPRSRSIRSPISRRRASKSSPTSCQAFGSILPRAWSLADSSRSGSAAGMSPTRTSNTARFWLFRRFWTVGSSGRSRVGVHVLSSSAGERRCGPLRSPRSARSTRYTPSSRAWNPSQKTPRSRSPPLAGLHAKVYVIDDGWKARVGIGSANSTEAALGDPPRNVEFMVELVGSKSKFGIDALLAPPGQVGAGTFRSLIEEFDPEEAGTVAEDEDAIRLDYLLDDAAETIARADLTGAVVDSDTGGYTLRLALGEPPGLPAEIGTVVCWPATLAAAHQQPLEDGVGFTDLSMDELSAFLAIEVQATIDGKSKAKRFARTIRLSGLPEDRLPRLIANMLRNRERFMQLLWLLLSPDQDLSFGELNELLSNEGSGTDWGVALPGLLERMLETLGSDPGKLDAVASLLKDLRQTQEGRELIGDNFDKVWEVLWTVRGRRK